MFRIPLHSQRAATMLAVGSSLFTVVMGVLAHSLRHEVDWRVVLAARATVALAITSWLARRSGHRLVFAATPGMWARSLTGAAIMTSLFYAYANLPASDVLVISNTFPLWLAILSVIVLGHRIRPAVIVALFAVVAGVVLVERPHLATGGVVVVTLLASVGIAVVTLILSKLRGIPSTVVAGHFFMVSIVTSLAMMLVPLEPRVSLHAVANLRASTWLSLLGVGVSGALVQLLFTRACQIGRSTRVAVASVMDVPLACVVDGLLGTRSFDATSLGGITIVLSAVLYLMLRPTESCHAIVATIAVPRSTPLEQADCDSRLVACIEKLELATACEMRVHVERSGEPSVAVAEAQFKRLSMASTLRRNALLLVLWPCTGGVILVTDEGISDVISKRSLASALMMVPEADIVTACTAVTERLTTLLAPTFPHPIDDTNELPDVITWGGHAA